MLKKLFFHTRMGWIQVILLSVVSAAAVALLNCIPALADTSLTAPAQTLELWIVLALVLIMNCRGYGEAMAKTFVFFLVGQPLIYLIEVPFKALGWGLFRYYPFWGFVTLLTVPGAALAYYVKKDNLLSAVILSLANALLLLGGFSRLSSVFYAFPRYLLAVVFCFAWPVLLTVTLLTKKSTRILAFVLAALVLIVGLFVWVVFPADSQANYPLEGTGWTVTAVSPAGLSVSVTEEDAESTLHLQSHKNGEYTVTLTDGSAVQTVYAVSVTGAEHVISLRKCPDAVAGETEQP